MTIKMVIGNKEVGRLEVQGPVSTLIQRKCCVCGTIMGYVNGHGKWGESHCYCPEDLKAAVEAHRLEMKLKRG